MKDRTLVAIALSTSSAGIFLLILAMLFLEIPETPISAIASTADGSPLHLKGEVAKTMAVGDRTIVYISQTNTIPVVVEETVKIEVGTCISVKGKRASYKGETQIDASKIERCD